MNQKRLAAVFFSVYVLVPSRSMAAEHRLERGTAVELATDQRLSSKTQVKGDQIALKTVADVVADGVVIIPAGTPAIGVISDARAKGALGMSGRLTLQPLYLQIAGRYVRLSGGAQTHATVTAGAVLGMMVLTPGFTGRSADFPTGFAVHGKVEHSVMLDDGVSSTR